MPEPEIIAHRGNGVGPSENTLAACQAAVTAGADRIELDVRLFRGQLVLSHDHPTEASESLDKILKAVRVPLILHIKRQWFSPWHDRAVIRVLAGVGRRDITISSFWPGTLLFAKRCFPKLRTAFITWLPDYDLLLAKRLGAAEYHVWHRTTGNRTVAAARRVGVKLVAFVTDGSTSEAHRLSAAGVDGLMTDSVYAFAGARPADR